MSLNKYTKDGATFFQLYISCPVCQEEGKNTPHAFWSHAMDGGDIYVSDKATFQCKDCGYTAHICKAQWGCPTHSGDSDEYVYKQATPAGLAAVMSCAGMMVTECGLPWLQNFMASLESGWR